MRKIPIVLLLFTLALPAWAVDLNPPVWRDNPRTTLQIWEFNINDVNPMPDDYVGPFDPQPADVKPYGTDSWLADYHGHQGVWPLSGEVFVPIINFPESLDEKRIWIQLTWRSKGGQPAVEASADQIPWVDGYQIGEASQLADGWYHSTYEIVLNPNPPEEMVHIYGAIYLDEMVIDTICIPEPTTVALLSIGGLLALRKRS